MNHSQWKPSAPPQPQAAQAFDLNSLLGLHKYLTELPTRTTTMETCLTHIETQLHTAITGIIVTKGPMQ
jgi:hypothetical protein